MAFLFRSKIGSKHDSRTRIIRGRMVLYTTMNQLGGNPESSVLAGMTPKMEETL